MHLPVSSQVRQGIIGISPVVKVNFAIKVRSAKGHEELVEKVREKVRLCVRRREDGPLKVKYDIDED